ncbi:MAG: hypothetical protein ACRENC_06710 [Gemmatimonadaceae bacterium]
MSVNDSVPQDKNTLFVTDTVRANLSLDIKDQTYFGRNRCVAATIATLPACATATVTTQVKTTNTAIFELGLSIVPYVSLTATDPLWTVVQIQAGDPNVLAIGSCRRWQLCWDGTSATTVATVRPSNDQVVANFASSAVALAACRWPSLPPQGTVIVGVASIVNLTNVFTPGTTLLGAAGVTTTYRDGPDLNCYEATPVAP